MRPSKLTDLLELIFGHVGEEKFYWDKLRMEVPELPRHPPSSLIETKMLISKGRDESYRKGTHQVWLISKDVTHWLQNSEPATKRRNN